MSALGIDIGGTSVKGALRADGRWTTAQSAAYSNPDRSALIDAVRSVVEQLGGCKSMAGLCVPGKQDADGRCVVQSVNLPALNGWAFDELFGACGLGTKVSVWSDAVAAGTDFVRTHEVVGRVACISMGTGVGLGVFDDGQVVGIGQRGIGHIGMVEIDRGQTLESVVGIPALRARFGDEIREGIAAMGKDDPMILAVVRMIRVVHAIYVPRSVVLMGGVGMTLEQHHEVIDRLTRDDGLAEVADSAWALEFGSSMFHAAMGAARLAQEG